MRKEVLAVFCIIICVLLTGCPRGRAKMPDVVSSRIRNYAIDEFDNNYKAYTSAVDSGNFDLAKIRRDELVFRLKRNIDANYADFENGLFLGKAGSNVLFDITELGAAAAVGITNGERAKTIIGTALTAFKGGRKSIDVNLFREKTTESLIQTMRASRSGFEEKLNLGISNNVKDYTLEEALGDLIDYFYAGSLSNALVKLSQEAADTAKEAKEKSDVQMTKRLEKEVSESRTINDLRNKIATDLASQDNATKSAARTRLLKVLGSLKTDLPNLGVTFTDNDSDETLFKELQRVLRQSAGLDDIPTAVILRALTQN